MKNQVCRRLKNSTDDHRVNNSKYFDKKKAEFFYRTETENYCDQGNREENYLSIDKRSLTKSR